MAESNKQIVQGLFDMVNQRRLDWVDQHVAEDCVAVAEAFIVRGVGLKAEDGKAVVEGVAEWVPGAGKLQPGDEILSVREGDRTYDTLETLLYTPWGLNPNLKIRVRARHNSEVFECEITPVVDKARRIPYPPSQWIKDLQAFYENTPEFHVETEYMVEEGDMVACFITHSGINKKFNNRPYAYSGAYVFGLADGKIVWFFEVHNTAAELCQQGHRILTPEV